MILRWMNLYFFVAFVVSHGLGYFSRRENGICLKTETYEATVYKNVEKKVPITKTHWCWKALKFFRCSHTEYKSELVSEPQKIQRERTVKVCCEGYVEGIHKFACIPQCPRGCNRRGFCLNPDYCSCFPGYYGPSCEKGCPRGRWGKECIGECKCLNDGVCNRETGQCTCEPGWQGNSCELPCPSGFYGFKCNEKCDCLDQICNHLTGECLTTPTKEEVTFTREVTIETTAATDIFTTKTQTEEYTFDLKTTTTEAVETTSVTETTSTEAMETTSVAETTSTEAMETTSVTETTSTEAMETTSVTETTSIEAVETTSVTETTSTEAVETTSVTETTSTEAVETTSVTETTSTEAVETTSTSETIARKAVETNFVTEITSATETTSTEAGETTSVSETNTRKELDTTFILETTVTPVNTNTETVFRKKSIDDSFGLYEGKDFGGVGSEEVDSNKLPEDPQVPVIKVAEKKGKGGEENFEVDNDLASAEENKEKKTSRLVFFVPSLTVLSGVSIMMFFIAIRWFIVWHRKRVRKLAMEMEERIFHPDGRRRFRPESFFQVGEELDNPVYLSDSHLNEEVPVLQTFKPLVVEMPKKSDANEVEPHTSGC